MTPLPEDIKAIITAEANNIEWVTTGGMWNFTDDQLNFLKVDRFTAGASFLFDHLTSQGWVSGEESKMHKAERNAAVELYAQTLQENKSLQSQVKELTEEKTALNDLVNELIEKSKP